MRLAIVTPVGNESEYATELGLTELSYVVARYPELKIRWYPVLDDFTSPEASERLYYGTGSARSWMSPLRIDGKRGVGYAYLRGFWHAWLCGDQFPFDGLIEMDLGHPAKLIPTFANALRTHPVVYGTRYGKGRFVNCSWRRQLLSRLGTIASHMVLDMPMSDCTSGFEAFRTSVVGELLTNCDIKSCGHMFQTEVKYLCSRLPFAEVPFEYYGGKSSLRLKSVNEAMRTLLRLRKCEPIDPGSIYAPPI